MSTARPGRRPLRAALAGLLAAALLVPAAPAGAVTAPTVRQVAAGYDTICMVLTDGRIRCAGNNEDGQLGIGTLDTGSMWAVTVSGISTAVAMDVSRISTHACALLADHTVACWGLNYEGAIGSGSSAVAVPTPEKVQSIDSAVAVATGTGFSCALMADHDIRCWGSNQYGKLGVSASTTSSLVPLQVPMVTDAVAIAAGAEHACALRSGGGIWCWGSNAYGQLGNAGSGGQPSVVDGITDAIAITAGTDYTCAVRANHSIWCWGYSDDPAGSVVGGGGPTSTPVRIGSTSDAVALAGGHYHACALRSTGTAVCWGRGMEYQLGNQAAANSSGPQDVVNLAGAASLTAGAFASCALLAGGEVDCWGANADGQMGNGTDSSQADPQEVDFIAPVVGTPTVRLAAGRAMAGTSIPLYVGYTAVDANGVDPAADAQLSSDGGSSWGAGGTVTAGYGATVAPSGTWRLRVVAKDFFGNAATGAASAAFAPLAVQQTSTAIVYGGTWRSESNAGYAGGSVKYATTAGASATWKGTAKAIGLVTTRGPGRGKVKVYVDGVLVATVDTYAATTTRKLVIWQRSWATAGAHTLKLVVVGTAGRPRVDLDALVALR